MAASGFLAFQFDGRSEHSNLISRDGTVILGVAGGKRLFVSVSNRKFPSRGSVIIMRCTHLYISVHICTRLR